MCISSRTQAITNPARAPVNNDMFICYLLTGVLAGIVIAFVLDDIHIYDMFFCYLLTGALVD
jgi:hypothetical protein